MIGIGKPSGCPRSWTLSSADGRFLGLVREINQRSLFRAVQPQLYFYDVELRLFDQYGSVAAEYRGHIRTWSGLVKRLHALEEDMLKNVPVIRKAIFEKARQGDTGGA